MSSSINLSNHITVKLGDLGYTYPGLSGKSKDDFGFGKPYIPYMNIFSNCKIKKSFLEYVDIRPTDRQNKVQTGDLFFTTSSETVEEVGMTSVLLDEIGEAYLNSFCFGFRLYNFDILSPEFAAFLFRGDELRKNISLFGQGSTRYNLPKTQMLQKLNLNLPDKIQQRKITHILTSCDSVIEQTQSAIAKYKAIKQGLLHDLFTRGLDANGHLRPSYNEAPELYEESELGMIPNEWEVKRLGDVINAIDPQPDHRTPESVENGIPYLGINDIDNFGKIDLRKCRKVSTEILEEHKKRYQIRNGDIIFGKIGTIGEPKRLYNFNNLTLSANVILIQPLGIADYIYWYLLSESVNKQINNSIHTTSQPAFGMDKIRSLKIPICEDIEQNEIAKRLNAIDNKIQTEENLLQKYQSIKRGLMGDLLGGKKEVV